jgi:hypothetical protein
MDALEASAASSTDTAWDALLGVVRAEYAEAVEKTVESTRTMRSYHDVDEDAIREAVRSNYEAVLNGLEERRRPDARDDGSVFDAAGETRAAPGRRPRRNVGALETRP